MAKTHESLAGVVDELLAQRVGKYRNILEDRHDELSDPLKDMRAVSLAAKLRLAVERGEPLWVDASGGVEFAVRGMLPKGPLGRSMLKKLKVYASPTHPHEAQQPKVLAL